jgi:hypothetical protein
VLAFDFDAYDETPSKATALTWKYSCKTVPWADITLDVSPDARLATFRYCDAQSGGRGDLRLDFLGSFYALVNTEEANTFVGELFVDYTVEFRQPAYRIPPALYQQLTSPNPWANPGTPNQWFTDLVKNIGTMAVEFLSANQLQIKDVGEFLVHALVSADDGISAAPTVTFATPAASPSANYDHAFLDSGYGSTAAQSTYRLSVKVPPVNLTFAQGSGDNLRSTVRLATYKGT